MSHAQPQLLVTGAGGQLGQLVVNQLLATVPANRITAMVRSNEAAAVLAARGVQTRIADYDRSDSLDAALAGIGRVLLISSSDLGRRVPQHRNVIEAAKRAGVGLLAYTSVLHADTSSLGLAGEHRHTEVLLRNSGVPFVLLRNGWYTENYTASIPTALAHRALIGSADEGRIASAARADYAAAAVNVLTGPQDLIGRTLELAGDEAYSLRELAAEIARQSGQSVGYTNLPEADYRAALIGAGLPEALASLLADSDVGASKGALFDNGCQLSALIGRPTTPMAATVAQALAPLCANDDETSSSRKFSLEGAEGSSCLCP
jgi:NAD(P)H dehydrogenase (quinone)